MKVHVGTSGFSYKEWKGSFYPADMKPEGMLRFYADRFDVVEVNNTFYRMPNPNVLTQWTTQVGEGFRFVLKAPQRITHQKRLHGVADDLSYFLATAARLESRLGPVLFQLPPFLKKDAPRLRELLAQLPGDGRAAFEFRHESWLDEEIFECLRSADAALCVADTDEAPQTSIRSTAGWGYLRLRGADYDSAALAAWAERVRSQTWSEAFVFFKHEDEGKGPALAAAFLRSVRE